MRRRYGAVAAAWLLAAGAPLLAHEFWVTPSNWRVDPGARVSILANVGDRFPNASSFTTPERVDSVRLVGPGTDLRVPGPYRRDGDSLAADVVLPAAAGTYVGVFTVKSRVGEKTGPIFEEHLRHQGLDDISAERARRGETHRAVRERYSRYGKTLVQAGSGGDDTAATRAVGLRIELVPATNPARLKRGEPLRVRLLMDGQPVRGALVGAINAGATTGPDDWPLKARTDANGDAVFTFTEGGPWLVRAVRMVRREGETGPEAADWETYWASLTFALPDAP